MFVRLPFTASSEDRPAHYARMVEPYTNYWNPSSSERSANPPRAYLQVGQVYKKKLLLFSG